MELAVTHMHFVYRAVSKVSFLMFWNDLAMTSFNQNRETGDTGIDILMGFRESYSS